MGVPTSEVGYTTAMPRREDHEVHKDMCWHWVKKIYKKFCLEGAELMQLNIQAMLLP
jgi:hypothetical protein